MVNQKSPNKIFPFMRGHPIMEMTVLLLLTMPVTAATPLRHTQRTQTDTLNLERSLERLKVVRSEDTEGGSVSVEMAPQSFGAADPKAVASVHTQNIFGQTNSVRWKFRSRRAPQRGCQLGTCQLHNLANTLYRIGQTNGKEESKNANDAHGYGR